MQGTKAIAQRMINAEENFADVLMVQAGISRADAFKAMRTMIKLRVAKIDAVTGRISVTHGAYLDVASIHNAVNLAR